jgi:hypothetical protein
MIISALNRKNEMLPRYALHAGYVTSINDGDEHYIGWLKLIRLYKLQPGEYCIWEPPSNLGRVCEDYIHLYPRADGNYHRPDKDI